jgi:aminoglycoside phosphotransferase family enzyme
MHSVRFCNADAEISLEDKVIFLSDPAAYPFGAAHVVAKETHMSWVFLAGARVYKLKKPIRSAAQDFSSPERREAACRAEFRVNRRLAEATYLGVVPLTLCPCGGLTIGGKGEIVDWLVVMQRLDEQHILEEKLLQHRSAGNRRAGVAAEGLLSACEAVISCAGGAH